ncbi:MAG: pantoate--beta-alanine ligase [Polyangiaceae bacterium UTPRO1]|jgi:pantoate--beta-alanine ligase|nr:pantoate--beta-alanine ligase [Myxococcales bacterium]OQY67992.1 MAG: pantoate--beta-alanine ligase [Polyangiaceae bacterium UTPRO1]
MRAIDQVSAMQAWSREVRGRDGLKVALVPTMGALHAGHLSLVTLARRHADRVVASVFVNPAQFDRADDLARYPRDLERDGALLAGAGADVLFAPDAAEIYPPGAQTFVTVEELAQPLCGAHRPGHFRGVATVVLKLFSIVQPDVAVFGEKDYQQLAVIRRMVRDLFLDVDVLAAPIVREADGLAMSSRNRHLAAAERAAARCLAAALAAGEAAVAAGERTAAAICAAATDELAREPLARVEYVALVDPDTLAAVTEVGERALLALAVWIGSTRLIDNRVLERRAP